MNFNNKKDSNKKVFLIVVIIVAVLLIILSRFGIGLNIFSKISSVVDKNENFIVTSFNGFMNGIKSKKKMQSEIKSLKEKNAKLELNILEMKKLETENLALRRKLEIKDEYKHFNLACGEVTVRDFNNWSESFIINIGTKQGIKEGMPVVSKEGLVGYVVSVEAETSKVVTILDSSTSVSVEISSINRPAMCKGEYAFKGMNKVKLTYIPIDAEISPGDTIYTSGIGTMYPKGLPLGKVVDIKNKKNDINRYAIVETFANIDSLNEIAVIIN